MSERTLALLQEVAEFLDPYVDVRDGEDGPLPNTAMSLLSEVEGEIEKLKSDDDTKRLNFIEKKTATMYRSMSGTYWVFIAEDVPHDRRRGIVGKTLREAVDAAIATVKP